MLPSAFESLTDPCLPDFWINTYTAAPGAITMTSVIIIFLVEFASTRYLANVDRQVTQNAPSTPPDSSGQLENGAKTEGHVHIHTHNHGHRDSTHFGHHHINPPPVEGEVDAHTAATQKLGVLILEAGIIFHSVFIGLTLAVSTGSNFISLFITIIFHRNPLIEIELIRRNIRRSRIG
jgi:solute carrier family 39 (zinc transporter), member 1/2/3